MEYAELFREDIRQSYCVVAKRIWECIQDLRHSEHLLVGLLEGIDALLEVDVIGGQLGL